MMNSQRAFMEQQQKSQQEFAKGLEERVRRDSDKNKEEGVNSKKTKCPKLDMEESLETIH